jgi:DNA-binding PadR family transcriptional regulator
MREEHRRGMRDEGWGPSPRPGGPEWGPRPGRGPGRRGGERGGPGWGGPGGHGGHGPRGDFGPPFGGFGPEFVLKGRGFGMRGPGARGMRVRKGDVRAAILDLLAEGGQWNGYQLIQEIAGRTSGVWRPSAGSVYPALQALEDEGLIAPEGEGRRRMYSLTDAGRTYADEHAEELSASWDAAAGMTDEDAFEFHDLIRQVMMAVMEVRRAGSSEQVAQARDVLAQAKRSLYRILAEDAADSEPQAEAGASDEQEDTE